MSVTSQTGKSLLRHFNDHYTLLLSFLFLILWISSFLLTDDRENWAIENILVVIFIPAFIVSRSKFRFTSTSYTYIFLFSALHVIGSMYAYSSVPLGFHIQQFFHLNRNPYDRIVHFSFGLFMAYPIYDLLKNKLMVTAWRTYVMPAEIILSLSAIFELIEWIIGGVLMPGSEKTYVGSQGDPWDAQKDMAMALIGAMIVMATLAWIHHKKKGMRAEVS